LERCPSCGYALRELPPIWTCPECGFDYDPHAKIIQLAPRRWALRQVFLGILLLTLAVWMLIREGAADDSSLEFIGFVGVLTLWYFLAYCRGAGEPSRLQLTRRGVRFEDASLDRGWIDWGRIRNAKYRWWSGKLCIVGVDGGQLWSARYERVGSAMVARDCADAINDRLRRYTSRQQ